MTALAQILFEISCTQDFQDFFQREIIQKGGITQKRKNTGHLFFHEESIYEISRH